MEEVYYAKTEIDKMLSSIVKQIEEIRQKAYEQGVIDGMAKAKELHN